MSEKTQALYFAVTRVEIAGNGYANGEVCLEDGALRMDIPDYAALEAAAATQATAQGTPTEDPDDEPAPGKSKPKKGKKKKDQAPPPDDEEPMPLKTVRIPVRDILRLSYVKSTFHPCRGFRLDCRKAGVVKFFFRSRREEKAAAFLVQTLLDQSTLTFDAKQSPNPARMQVWSLTERQSKKR